MSSFKNVLVALGILVVTTTANASFLVEPHVGYIASGGISSYNNLKFDYTGPQYGARLGVKYLGVMGGFDYTRSSFSLKQTMNAAPFTSGSGKQKQEELGIFVGYNAPVMLRAWIGYYFSTKMTQTETTTTGTNGDWLKGKTTEIGLGFTPFPVISINLVYRMLSFDKAHDASPGAVPADSTLTTKYEPKEIVLGVSVPFSLL